MSNRNTTESVGKPLSSERLRLYVVGESSGNPTDWSERPNRALVIAASADEAIAIADMGTTCTAEVCFDAPIVLSVDESGLQDNL